MDRLDDVRRLEIQVGETDLERLLALRGNEDILDLGSGTGFYADRIAALTTGLVYALEIVPEMLAHHQERGLPKNVRLARGDMTDLSPTTLTGKPQPDGLTLGVADVAITIATWHEIEGRLDVPGLAGLLRPGGRFIVLDWRKDPESWDNGPPEDARYSTDEVAATLASHFAMAATENVGPSMFAVTARRM